MPIDPDMSTSHSGKPSSTAVPTSASKTPVRASVRTAAISLGRSRPRAATKATAASAIPAEYAIAPPMWRSSAISYLDTAPIIGHV